MATTLKLYEATSQLDTVRDWLIEAGGELTPEIEALLAEAQDAFTAKAERVALFIQELLATAAAVKQERERLAKLEQSYTTGAANLKKYLQREMERAAVPKVEGALVKIRLQKNSQPAVQCEDPTGLFFALQGTDDAELVTRVEIVEYRLQRDAVLARWKAGDALPPGITVEQGQHVRIS